MAASSGSSYVIRVPSTSLVVETHIPFADWRNTARSVLARCVTPRMMTIVVHFASLLNASVIIALICRGMGSVILRTTSLLYFVVRPYVDWPSLGTARRRAS